MPEGGQRLKLVLHSDLSTPKKPFPCSAGSRAAGSRPTLSVPGKEGLGTPDSAKDLLR